MLFGYRQALFAEAARTSIAQACRRFGVHRSTYYAWKRQVDRHGLEMLRPRERRRPKMPNQLSKMVEERIVAFSIAHPGLGPKRIASELRRAKWGGVVVSPNGAWKVLCRHGLNTRAKDSGRMAIVHCRHSSPNPTNSRLDITSDLRYGPGVWGVAAAGRATCAEFDGVLPLRPRDEQPYYGKKHFWHSFVFPERSCPWGHLEFPIGY